MNHQKDWTDRKFIRINHSAVEEGFYQNLAGNEVKVLEVRLHLANDYGDCDFASYWVSKKTNLSLPTVLSAERKLEDLGWLLFNRQTVNGKKRKTEDGKWAKNTCRINFNRLPNYLRGVFRQEDRSKFFTTSNEPTVDKNFVTEKTATNSLKENNSLVVSSTKQLFEELFFPLREERDLLSLRALQKRYGDGKLQRFFRWFKESRKNYKVTSIRLFERVIPDWIRDGEPTPPPKFVPCGKCDNGYFLDKERDTYVECDCHAEWEERLELSKSQSYLEVTKEGEW